MEPDGMARDIAPRFARVCVVLMAALGLGVWSAAPAAEEDYVTGAVKVARELMGSENIFDRITAAGTLVDVGDRPALAFLLESSKSTDFIIQRSAIDTLLSVQHPDGLDTIYREASRGGSFQGFLVESLAARPRKDMGEFLVSILDAAEPRLQQYALQALINSEAPGLLDHMHRFATDGHIDLTTKAYVYYVLTDLGKGAEVLPKLMEIVETGNGSEQEAAAVALGMIDSEQSKLALGRLRESKDERVVLAALASHAGLGNEDAIAHMVQLIAYGKPMESTVVAASLKRLPPKLAAQVTSVVLGCCKLQPDVAGRLLESWGWIEGDASIVYAWGLASEDVDVRLQTLWLIGQRKDRSMLKTVAGYLGDPEERIRAMAAWTIVHIDGETYTGGLQTVLASARG